MSGRSERDRKVCTPDTREKRDELTWLNGVGLSRHPERRAISSFVGFSDPDGTVIELIQFR